MSSSERPNGPPLIYRLTVGFGSLSLRLFYRRIDAVNRHNLPATGPVVLAANHPNYIIDALAIGSTLGAELRIFDAAGTELVTDEPLSLIDPLLTYTFAAGGTYQVHVSNDNYLVNDAGPYMLFMY